MRWEYKRKKMGIVIGKRDVEEKRRKEKKREKRGRRRRSRRGKKRVAMMFHMSGVDGDSERNVTGA